MNKTKALKRTWYIFETPTRALRCDRCASMEYRLMCNKKEQLCKECV